MPRFGNDVTDLIRTYSREILNARKNHNTESHEYFIQLHLAALPIFLFSNIYGCFKDPALGKKLNREFLEEFDFLMVNEMTNDLLFSLIQKVKAEVSNKGFSSYSSFYSKSIGCTVTNEESTWIRNYINAVKGVYVKFNAAAVREGFIEA
jgi:hypothetical protein